MDTWFYYTQCRRGRIACSGKNVQRSSPEKKMLICFIWICRVTTEVGKSGKRLKTPGKYPYHIGVKDSPYFFIAGVWQNWTDKDTGETIPTAALITTFANGLMRQIHNSKLRMP